MPAKEDGSMQIAQSKSGATSRNQPAKHTDVCYKISLSKTIWVGGGDTTDSLFLQEIGLLIKS